jgi:ATP-dependent DNA helicase Q1
LTHQYLQEEYHETAYCRVVYVAPGPAAAKLSHHTLQSIKGEVKRKLEFLFTSSKIRSGTKRKSIDPNQPSGPKKRKVSGKSGKAKGKMRAVEPDNQDDFADEDEPAIVLSDQVELEDIFFLSDDDAPDPSRKILDKNVPDDDDDDIYESFDQNLSDDNNDSTNNYEWSHSLLEEPRARFKPYSKNQTKTFNRSTMNIIQEGDNEVIMLSSD